jgi:hypothetical protein
VRKLPDGADVTLEVDASGNSDECEGGALKLFKLSLPADQ